MTILLKQPYKLPIPSNLPIPNPETPWRISPDLFAQMDKQETTLPYKKWQLQTSDPEFQFVHQYFSAMQPTNRAIKAVWCVQDSAQSNLFESNIAKMEKEANNPYFQPKWRAKENSQRERQEASGRFDVMASLFSPFSIKWPNSRKDTYSKTKVLPLWHGSDAQKCDSICQSGFSFFGKHLEGNNQSTDPGFFGSGIYFTNSARYAADIYSNGHLLLAWVSMREPFPVVADRVSQDTPSDMNMLEGRGAYENYNAHFVPVISLKPSEPMFPTYYPCALGQKPMCDEFVVFHGSQALPKFWVEMIVDLPVSPSNINPSETVGSLLDTLMALVDNQEVKKNTDLCKALEGKTKFLLTLSESKELSQEDLDLHKKIKRLIGQQGKVQTLVAESLLGVLASPMQKTPNVSKEVPSSQIKPPKPKSSPFDIFKIFSHKPEKEPTVPPLLVNTQQVSSPLPVTPKIPSMAFGKAKWEQCFGDIGVEPALPTNIEEILDSQCPIWPDKKVHETHMLTLIPKTVNGQLLTLKTLGELVQHPKQGGNVTSYSIFYPGGHENTPAGESHWVLMARDVIPDSRKKIYKEQVQLAQTYNKNGIEYEVPKLLDATVGIFMEYVQTGTRLFSDDPWTYTRCQEQYVNTGYQMVVGGFSASGLRVCRNDCDDEIVGISLLQKFC